MIFTDSVSLMMRNRGLGTKLAVLILTAVTVIFTSIFIYNYFVSRQIIYHNIKKSATNLALATVNRLDGILYSFEKVPESLARFLESSPYGKTEILGLIRSVVEENQEIYGSTVAFEPYTFNSDHLRFAPYFYELGAGMSFTFINYNYFSSDWYQIAKELANSVWSEPYYDEGAGEIVMTTYSVPFYREVDGKKTFVGVVTADVSLSWLQEIVDSIKIEKSGYAFLVTKNGTFVSHPNSDIIMNETIFSLAEIDSDGYMRELGRKMIHGESGFVPFRTIGTDKKCWMAYAPLSSSGWSLGVLFPQDELMEDIFELNRTVLFLGIAGLSLILLLIILISQSITRPLRALSEATGEIGSGNLDVAIPAMKAQDEVGKLAHSFEYMRTSLKDHIRELKETTAAKERIESELQIARNIQMGILHKIFPPFPNRTQFDIYATLDPAREVGGDLYDFFFVDENRLCFTVGDVSGKGVPAALFMAIVMTLIRTTATSLSKTDAILTNINNSLSSNNPSMMFVTLFLGILNIRTGEVEYGNGGHNPPYIISSKYGLREISPTGDIALGVLENFSYQSKKIILEKKDSIFLYTDGVTEAMNERKEMFTEERMVQELKALSNEHQKTILKRMLEIIKKHSHAVEQTDDITMMMLNFYGDR
jgi:sigma-B regulation protein RsbU (phosphoserine phosphatase)